MPSAAPPHLRHIANLWSLVDYPDRKKPWPLERQLAAVKAADFDGFTARVTAEHAKLAARLGLYFVGQFSTGKAGEIDGLLRQNADAGVTYINVQLGDHDTPTDQAVRLAVRVMELGRKHGVKPSVEVHRDTCTETPEKTYALTDGYRQATGELLPVTWDFSHIAVVKHLAPPYWNRLLVAPKLLQHAQQFHFRPFNGHHAQVPVTDGKGKLSAELTAWLPFVEKTFETWLAGKQDGREIFVVPEMGPAAGGGGYNLSTLPNSWEDAKVLRPILARAWRKVLAARKAKLTLPR